MGNYGACQGLWENREMQGFWENKGLSRIFEKNRNFFSFHGTFRNMWEIKTEGSGGKGKRKYEGELEWGSHVGNMCCSYMIGEWENMTVLKGKYESLDSEIRKSWKEKNTKGAGYIGDYENSGGIEGRHGRLKVGFTYYNRNEPKKRKRFCGKQRENVGGYEMKFWNTENLSVGEKGTKY